MANPNLRFFDSESNDLNLLYNSETNIWEGVCYLPKVSTGLYETLTIYILEQVEGELGGDKFITPIGSGQTGSKFKFNFFSGYEFSEDIFMYSAKNNNGIFEIQKDDVQIHPILNAGTSSTTNGDGFKIIPESIPMVPVKCNIALMSEEDNYHTRILDIYETKPAPSYMLDKSGALYNYYAVSDSRNIAPPGWHVPTLTEWNTLLQLLEDGNIGVSIAGGKLKETGFAHWNSPNTGATNESGFTAIGVGVRDNLGFGAYQTYASFWTSTQYNATQAHSKSLRNTTGEAHAYYGEKQWGKSVRLIKDDSVLNDMTGNDGKVYQSVKIGSQVWMSENLNETKYRNGDWINGYNDGVYTPKTNSSWNTLNSSAMCYYNDNQVYGAPESTEVEQSLIASIRIYGETESEDERLSVLLSNMGMSLSEEEYMILKDSNILEFSPDWILMNQKRKELLLQASEIKPFVGTYKALLNAIDFYGYNKITIKEYWLNINEQAENFGKLQAIAIPNQDTVGFLANKNQGNQLPSSNLKKTSRFSLVYRLNETDGKVDEWDIPTVVESTDYSPDEVLIKLYGLKNKLQSTYLPLQAKIVDITGEGDYFAQFNLNVWNNQHFIKDQTAGQNVDFSRYPKEKQLYIEDLRKVDYRLTGINQDFSNFSDTIRESISESIINFYDGYYIDDLSSFNTLDGIPVGCPVILNAESFIGSWDSAEFTFIDAEDTGDHLLTLDNWWRQGIYEMEWTILGPKGYSKSFRGGVGYYDGAGVFHPEYQQFPIVLPYSGVYSVELSIFDLYNVRSSYRKPNYFEVKNKNVEVYGIFQRMLPQLNWNQYKYSYDIAGSDWDWARENTIDVDSVIATYYLTLDRANYIHDEEDGPEFSIVRRYLDSSTVSGFNETAGPYQWRELRTQVWEDGDEVNWNMMRVGADVNSSFKIDLRQSSGYNNGGYYFYITQYDVNTNQLVSDTYAIQNTYPVDENDLAAWSAIANELSQLDPEVHPILTKFNYNPILVDIDANGNEDVCNYILVVAEEPSRTHDYQTAGFSDFTGGGVISGSEIHFESFNPNYQDICVIDSHMAVKRLNHVTFSYDTTNMPGIIGQKWTLKNNNENVNDIYYSNTWLTYLFKHKGDYTVELELTDVNGNKNTINKNILKII